MDTTVRLSTHSLRKRVLCVLTKCVEPMNILIKKHKNRGVTKVLPKVRRFYSVMVSLKKKRKWLQALPE